jgi:hypothetical protein
MVIFYVTFFMFSVVLCADCNHKRSWSEGEHPSKDTSVEIPFEKKTESYSANHILKIQVDSTYPIFQNKNLFVQEINKQLCSNAQEIFHHCIQQFSEEEKENPEFNEEDISMDFDQRNVSYVLTPTYASSRLVSVFGEFDEYVGLPHGSTHYYTFNYWFDGKETQGLSLSNLFLADKDFIAFIIDYCLSTLQQERVGYNNELFRGFEPNDLNVFTLTRAGLTLTFQPYHVGGWADGPYSITIPFQKLTPFIKSRGPLEEFLSSLS